MREPSAIVVDRRTRFARLPRNDLSELHAANSAFWRAIAGELAAGDIIDIPAAIDRSTAPACEHDGVCLFTQSCGYPLLTTARDLAGIDECEIETYAVVLAYERDAQNAGYPALR